MKTSKIIGVLLLVIILGLAIWKLPRQEAQAPTEQTPASTNSTSSIAGATKNADGDFEYKNDTDLVTFHAVYPAKTSLSGDADVRARTTMENWIKEQEAGFSADNKDMIDAAEAARLREQHRQYAMDIKYKEYSSPDHVSYVFQIYEDTGGAHPNGFYATFTFDKNGTKIELADLFKPGARYLDRLSKASYDYLVVDLAKRFNAPLDPGQLDMLRIGTEPSPEALQFYYLNGTNLVLIFPPYQVAAYVAGTSEVPISLASLKDILR